MSPNHSQAQTANDVCKCRACNMEQPVTIIPDLPVNKWTCRNCNLLQVWQPSESFNKIHEVVSRHPFSQGTLFNAGPFVGIGVDGCLSGVFPDPSHTDNIFLAAAGIALIAIIIEYYRVKLAMYGDPSKDAMYHTEPGKVHASDLRKKAPNKVSGVDNWNRQPSVMVMSKAQSVAMDKRRGGLLITFLSKSFQRIFKPSKLASS